MIVREATSELTAWDDDALAMAHLVLGDPVPRVALCGARVLGIKPPAAAPDCPKCEALRILGGYK